LVGLHTIASMSNAKIQQPYCPYSRTDPFSSCPPVPASDHIFCHPPHDPGTAALPSSQPPLATAWAFGERRRFGCLILQPTLHQPRYDERDLEQGEDEYNGPLRNEAVPIQIFSPLVLLVFIQGLEGVSECPLLVLFHLMMTFVTAKEVHLR
jgi:hypothetical protein